jgi:AGZA family xanthine/uracil permease-like MFS transporter
MIERLFRLSQNKTTARTEALAGLTTFLTMAYIIFVQPAVLSGKMFGITGLTSLVVAALFLLALFLSPLIAMIGGYPPITAPALTIVGAMMMQNVTKIEWKDYTESIPAFLIIIGIPLSYSIADGLALGFISYAIIKAFSGRSREISWITYVLAIVLVLYFVFVRSRMG